MRQRDAAMDSFFVSVVSSGDKLDLDGSGRRTEAIWCFSRRFKTGRPNNCRHRTVLVLGHDGFDCLNTDGVKGRDQIKFQRRAGLQWRIGQGCSAALGIDGYAAGTNALSKRFLFSHV